MVSVFLNTVKGPTQNTEICAVVAFSPDRSWRSLLTAVAVRQQSLWGQPCPHCLKLSLPARSQFILPASHHLLCFFFFPGPWITFKHCAFFTCYICCSETSLLCENAVSQEGGESPFIEAPEHAGCSLAQGWPEGNTWGGCEWTQLTPLFVYLV